MLRAKITADQGAIPFVYTGFPSFLVTKGQYDRFLLRMAKNARRFGEKYGGFFINTVWEMNIDTVARHNLKKHGVVCGIFLKKMEQMNTLPGLFNIMLISH